jgi:hypothetical protein
MSAIDRLHEVHSLLRMGGLAKETNSGHNHGSKCGNKRGPVSR